MITKYNYGAAVATRHESMAEQHQSMAGQHHPMDGKHRSRPLSMDRWLEIVMSYQEV